MYCRKTWDWERIQLGCRVTSHSGWSRYAMPLAENLRYLEGHHTPVPSVFGLYYIEIRLYMRGNSLTPEGMAYEMGEFYSCKHFVESWFCWFDTSRHQKSTVGYVSIVWLWMHIECLFVEQSNYFVTIPSHHGLLSGIQNIAVIE